MSKDKFWWSTSSGRIEFELPREAVEDCHHQGECYDDCKHWQGELNLNLDRKTMIRELLEYGAWNVRELCALDNDELEIKLIWIAAGDIQDSGDMDEPEPYEMKHPVYSVRPKYEHPVQDTCRHGNEWGHCEACEVQKS